MAYGQKILYYILYFQNQQEEALLSPFAFCQHWCLASRTSADEQIMKIILNWIFCQLINYTWSIKCQEIFLKNNPEPKATSSKTCFVQTAFQMYSICNIFNLLPCKKEKQITLEKLEQANLLLEEWLILLELLWKSLPIIFCLIYESVY